jgi:hypothetical protein
MSKLQEALAAIEKIEDLKRAAVIEIDAEIEKHQIAIDELQTQREQLTGESVKPTTKHKSGATKRPIDPNKVCKVCGEKGHDARKHRHEGKIQPPPVAPKSK